MILFIPAVRVQAANAAPSSLIVNAVPVLPLLMLAHALGRACGQQPTALAIVHHDALPLGEDFPGRYSPQQRRGAVFINDADYPQGSKALSLQPTANAHLLLSLAFRFDDAPDTTSIRSFLRSARIAGGSVLEYGPFKTFDTETELLGFQRSGFWLIERADLIDADDPLDSLLSALQSTPVKRVAGLDFKSNWLSGAVLGYAATTEFKRRSLVREGDKYLHAYCEPLIGLVQHVSVNEYRVVTGDAPRVPWWSSGWLQDDVFLCRQEAPLIA